MNIFDFAELYTGKKIAKWQRLAFVAEIVRRRAFMYTCSYETAWNNWLDDGEKAGFTFEELAEVL